jgi:murein DD-endopeptidase MepM/ murein hydrolase activator NlpD
LKQKIPVLSQLRRENQQQEKQFTRLAERINRMAEKIDELKELDQKLRIMVNLEGSDEQAKPEGIGGSQPTPWRYEYDDYQNQDELVHGMHDALDDLTREIDLGKRQKTSLHAFFKEQKRLLASTPSIWPVRGWLSSRFGYRTSPFTGKKEFHRGLDISARIKTPVIAPADGTVSAIRWDRWSGNVLCLSHGYGLKTVYAHLSKIVVDRKQFVRRGETVALVGNTGRSTGPHLHYEVHVNKIAVDPMRYILDE